jgi:hypothetical protein
LVVVVDDDDDECNPSVEPYHNTHMHVLFPMVNSWRTAEVLGYHLVNLHNSIEHKKASYIANKWSDNVYR